MTDTIQLGGRWRVSGNVARAIFTSREGQASKATLFTSASFETRCGWRTATDSAMPPPTSCPTMHAKLIPSASRTPTTRSAWERMSSDAARGGSLRPNPSKSRTTTRCPLGSRGTTSLHRWLDVGKPCSSTIGSPAPREPAA